MWLQCRKDMRPTRIYETQQPQNIRNGRQTQHEQIEQARQATLKFGTESGGNLPDQKQAEETAVMFRAP
jgi:hypothetical protein